MTSLEEPALQPQETWLTPTVAPQSRCHSSLLRDKCLQINTAVQVEHQLTSFQATKETVAVEYGKDAGLRATAFNGLNRLYR
jgi:hypothetical protein